MVRTPHFHCGGWVRSLAGELRFHKRHGAAKKEKKVCSPVTLNYTSKLNGHVWLVVTVLDRDDRILQSAQKILLDSTGINNVWEEV